MKNVVITGATSFIGRYLVDEFLKDDLYRVYAVIRENSSKIALLPKDNRVKIINADMSEYYKLDSKIQENIYCFIHLAWGGVRGTGRNDTRLQEDNFKNSVEALTSAIALKTQFFLSAGSQAEYGPQVGLVTEDTMSLPQTEYGKFKLKFYTTAKELCQEQNIKFYEPRFFSLYGYGDSEQTLVISMLHKMLKNEPYNLTDCTQKWNFLHVKDAVYGIKMLIDNAYQDGIYNFGSSNTRSLKYFVQSIKEISRSKSELNFGSIPHNDSGTDGLNPCTAKLRSIGWQEKISFNEGIRGIIEKIKEDKQK